VHRKASASPFSFNALAPLDERLSGSQRNAIVSRTRAQVCYVLDSSAAALRERLSRQQRAVCRLLRVSGAGASLHALAQRPVGQLQLRRRRGVGQQRQQ